MEHNVVTYQCDAFDPTLALGTPYAEKGVRGVFHCFVSEASVMRQIVVLNRFVNFGIPSLDGSPWSLPEHSKLGSSIA
ncbi:MAG: hypothetical protein M2R45_04316 [Verrucomicrobia subdivision 3 bacterium]|nr:hypothetical protein [Limisphaerales bacterium]MCS1417231.1 hypothetical protein [Limisphaerales bacterium]